MAIWPTAAMREGGRHPSTISCKFKIISQQNTFKCRNLWRKKKPGKKQLERRVEILDRLGVGRAENSAVNQRKRSGSHRINIAFACSTGQKQTHSSSHSRGGGHRNWGLRSHCGFSKRWTRLPMDLGPEGCLGGKTGWKEGDPGTERDWGGGRRRGERL